jgi:hypothetical protein
MMQKVRVMPSRRRIWLGWIASCLLVGLGCLQVHNGRKFGWFVIILFGLGVIAPGVLLLPGASWLELDDEGFTLCLSFKPSRYLWSDITEMAISRGVVSFKFAPEHRGNRRGQTAARALSGYDGSIPNMFQQDPQSLLELMMRFKQNQQIPRTPQPTTEPRFGAWL